jgi:hypothetical protein
MTGFIISLLTLEPDFYKGMESSFSKLKQKEGQSYETLSLFFPLIGELLQSLIFISAAVRIFLLNDVKLRAFAAPKINPFLNV